jgi:hypothetical protein
VLLLLLDHYLYHNLHEIDQTTSLLLHDR